VVALEPEKGRSGGAKDDPFSGNGLEEVLQKKPNRGQPWGGKLQILKSLSRFQPEG